MKVLLTSLSLLLLSTMFASGQTRDWRGLTPLSSTRVDVERVLGEPTESSAEFSVFYRTSTETIIINYTQGLPCGGGKKHNRWKVPKDVIESMLVTPLKSLTLAQLPFDRSKFVTSQGVERPEDTVYSDEENGLSIRTFRGEVTAISLYPGRRDRHLLCTDNQMNVYRGCHGPIPPPLDSYGSLTWDNEKVRLDNFAVHLQRYPQNQGVVVSYGGKEPEVRQRTKVGQKVKNYLVRIRKIAPERVKLIDGGPREEKQVELYILSPLACPPLSISGNRGKSKRRSLK